MGGGGGGDGGGLPLPAPTLLFLLPLLPAATVAVEVVALASMVRCRGCIPRYDTMRYNTHHPIGTRGSLKDFLKSRWVKV